MATVAESSGTVNFDQHLTDTHVLWREAVATVAERAKAMLPQCHDRIDHAVTLVLAGEVTMSSDGTARVASQCNGATQYHIVNGLCDCTVFPTAYEGWCQHRLAHAMAKRAYPLAKAKLDGASARQAPRTADLD